MKIALVQNASGEHVKLLNFTRNLHERRCREQGVFYCPSIGRVTERHPNWDRFPLLTSLLGCGFDGAIWMDADCLIYGEEPLERMFDEVEHVGMARYPFSWKDWGFNYNGGVIAVRNTAPGKNFLSTVWYRGELPTDQKGWINQPAIQTAVEEGCPVTAIDRKWNYRPRGEQPEGWQPVVYGFHGMGVEQSMAGMFCAIALSTAATPCAS